MTSERHAVRGQGPIGSAPAAWRQGKRSGCYKRFVIDEIVERTGRRFRGLADEDGVVPMR